MPKARQQLLTPPRDCSGNALSSERCWRLQATGDGIRELSLVA